MTPSREDVVRDLSRKVKQRFPQVNVLGYREMPDGAISIKITTPDDSAWDVALEMNEEAVELLLQYGYLVAVSPIEDSYASDKPVHRGILHPVG